MQEFEFARPSLATIHRLFDEIPDRYDFLNSLFSFGTDGRWRKRLVEATHHSFVKEGRTTSFCRVLDLGAGTGKSTAEFLHSQSYGRIFGCDFSLGMLGVAHEKMGRSCDFASGDFHSLPVRSESVDVVTGSFILRSAQNLAQLFGEANRILKPGGKVAFLELTRPKNRIFWTLAYLPYLKFYIPLVGRLFSKHNHAYKFLSQSIQTFSDPGKLSAELEACGFVSLSLTTLSWGLATIIIGTKGNVA
jgi:demethylmenaquinone methyltransferase / 2-methoxy-6-polyprenyl-1,4-benzoquinol methylase